MARTNDWIECDVPQEVPVLLLKSEVLFPMQVVSVQVAMKENLQLLEDHLDPDEIIGAGVYLNPEGIYTPDNLCTTAAACRVLSRVKMENETVQVVLQGLRRIEIAKPHTESPYFRANAECIEETGTDAALYRNDLREMVQIVEDLVEVDERYTEELVKMVKLNLKNGSRCADLVAHLVHFSYVEKRKLLEKADVADRIKLLIAYLKRLLARSRISAEVQVKTEQTIKRSERVAFLREQLNTIREELKELDPAQSEIAELDAIIDSGLLPPLVAEEARREIIRLQDTDVHVREGSSIRAYIEWVLSFPWKTRAKELYDLRRARRILDNRYFGLGNARDRLLEFLAVRKLGGDSGTPLLGIMGPPGTGRTSLATTVAKILDRPLVRVPVQGVHDEAEFRGQQRAQPGARPGWFLDGIHASGVRNPVIHIDEYDRLEPGVGDPELAILEALNPSRNRQFFDHYLGVAYDLSDVLFIISANFEEEIPESLWDVMYTIELAGFTEGVKMAIARERIWPHVLEKHGLSERGVTLTNAAMRMIIRRYTQEAGVHYLKLKLETICRRVAVRMASGDGSRLSISTKNLEKFLGKPIYAEGEVELKPEIGTAIGLAWTETGGNLLPIEALIMPGYGSTLLTGLLGEVMQESVRAALSYVRSLTDELGLVEDVFRNKDIHVHFPEGAIPKDGPSAGIAVATAIASIVSGRPVRRDIAMTGEISLRGHVLPVGGIREKVLAAYRAGIRHVILPAGNESDLTDVPKDVSDKMRFRLVEEAVEVFRIALDMKKKPSHKHT